MNTVSPIVVGIALLGVLLLVNSTFNHKYDNARPIVQETSGQAPISVSDLEDLKGNIISIHGNGSTIPVWIVSGKWKVAEYPTNNTNITNGNIKFNANVTMTSIDGMNVHRHKLADFKLLKINFQNRSATINGSISFNSSGSNIGIPGESLKQIPISVNIMNLRTVSIIMDNNMIKEHFGNSPIYGKVD